MSPLSRLRPRTPRLPKGDHRDPSVLQLYPSVVKGRTTRDSIVITLTQAEEVVPEKSGKLTKGTVGVSEVS